MMSDPAVAAGRQPRAEPVAAGHQRDRARRSSTRRPSAVTSAVEDQASAKRRRRFATRRSSASRSCWRPAHRARSSRARWSGRCAGCATAPSGSPTRTWPANSSGCAPGGDAGAGPAAAGAHHRGGRAGRARRRRTARAGRAAWPASRPGCSCRSATCSRRCRGAAGRWSTSSWRSSTASSATRKIPSGWTASSSSTTSPRACAATAPTCWCWPAPRCRASRPTRCRSPPSSTPRPPRSRTTPGSSPRPCRRARSSASSRATSSTCWPSCWTTRCGTRRRRPQVRVSAVHTGNGGLVIEVSDNGLGMTDADLRVANTRLQSGGEVNPYTARHMGLFVVGRLAAQHGLVVRLRSTVAGRTEFGHHRRCLRARRDCCWTRWAASVAADDRRSADYGMPASEPHARRRARATLADDYAEDHADEPTPMRRRPSRSTATAMRTSRFRFCRNATRVPAASPAFRRPRRRLGTGPRPRRAWPDDPSRRRSRRPAAAGRAAADAGGTAGRRARRADATPRRSSPPGPGSRVRHIEPPVDAPAQRPVEADCGPSRPKPTEAVATETSDDSIFDTMLSEWLIDDPVRAGPEHRPGLADGVGSRAGRRRPPPRTHRWREHTERGSARASARCAAGAGRRRRGGDRPRRTQRRRPPGQRRPIGGDDADTGPIVIRARPRCRPQQHQQPLRRRARGPVARPRHARQTRTDAE